MIKTFTSQRPELRVCGLVVEAIAFDAIRTRLGAPQALLLAFQRGARLTSGTLTAPTGVDPLLKDWDWERKQQWPPSSPRGSDTRRKRSTWPPAVTTPVPSRSGTQCSARTSRARSRAAARGRCSELEGRDVEQPHHADGRRCRRGGAADPRAPVVMTAGQFRQDALAKGVVLPALAHSDPEGTAAALTSRCPGITVELIVRCEQGPEPVTSFRVRIEPPEQFAARGYPTEVASLIVISRVLVFPAGPSAAPRRRFKHRNSTGDLCLYYSRDDPALVWWPEDGARAAARHHPAALRRRRVLAKARHVAAGRCVAR